MSRLPLTASSRIIRPWLIAVTGGLLGCTGAWAAEAAPVPAPALDALQREVQTIFDKCRSAVVRIEASDQRGYLSGTGFFIDPNGTLYTSYTVGGESRDIQVAFGG